MSDDVDRLPRDDVACALGGHLGCVPLLSACDDLPRAVSLRELSRELGWPEPEVVVYVGVGSDAWWRETVERMRRNSEGGA